MALNKWRKVGYTDDGCTEYECLSCYKGWEGRGSPHQWTFCPHCGTKWDGCHEWNNEEKHGRKFGTYDQRNNGVGRFSKNAEWVIYKKEIFYEDNGIFQTEGWERVTTKKQGFSFDRDCGVYGTSDAKDVKKSLEYMRKNAIEEEGRYERLFGRLEKVYFKVCLQDA